LAWTVKFRESALKELEKLSKPEQLKIRDYLRKRLLKAQNPRDFGKTLRNNKAELWCYRIEKFRLICQIKEDQFCILIIKIGKRDKVYE